MIHNQHCIDSIEHMGSHWMNKFVTGDIGIETFNEKVSLYKKALSDELNMVVNSAIGANCELPDYLPLFDVIGRK